MPAIKWVGHEKKDGHVVYGGGGKAPDKCLYAGLADGPYSVGFRAHQLALADGRAGHHLFPTTVALTEITGSESFVHLKRDGANWVAGLPGVHEFPPGHALAAALEPNAISGSAPDAR